LTLILFDAAIAVPSTDSKNSELMVPEQRHDLERVRGGMPDGGLKIYRIYPLNDGDHH